MIEDFRLLFFRTACLHLLIWALLSPGTVFTQDNRIDSLQRLTAGGNKDTAMVNALNALSLEVLYNEDITNSLIYSKQADELAQTLKYERGRAYAQKHIGLAYYYQGNYLEVLDFWTQSMETFKGIRDTVGMANILNNLGGVYLTKGSYEKALEYYLQSLYYAEKIKDTVRITSVLPNVGALYGDMKNYGKALVYYKQLEPYLESLNDPQITSYYLMGIGEIYKKMNNYDKAFESYNKALPINENTFEYPHILKELGILEYENGNTEKSIEHLNLAYKTAKEKNLQLDVLGASIELGNVYSKINYSKALDMYGEAEILAKEMETASALRDIYKGISNTYARKGDFQNAYMYQNRYLVQKDSVFNLEINDQIRNLQFNFELEKKEDKIGLLEQEAVITQLQGKRQKSATYLAILVSLVILLLALIFYYRYNYAKKSNKLLSAEKNRSESLLLNILPEATALELKKKGKVEAKKFESVTVMFADFKGFTEYSQELSPEDLVESVDFYFSGFDKIMDKYELEKIKTIGDAYMCAGGLPYPTKDHAVRMVNASLEIIEFMESVKKDNDDNIMNFEIRIGINTGPVVAGVVGFKKFAYDIWGDTVNVAARMESMSKPGSINISETTYEKVKDIFVCEQRGEIYVKNKGMMNMYFVNQSSDKSIKVARESNQHERG